MVTPCLLSPFSRCLIKAECLQPRFVSSQRLLPLQMLQLSGTHHLPVPTHHPCTAWPHTGALCWARTRYIAGATRSHTGNATAKPCVCGLQSACTEVLQAASSSIYLMPRELSQWGPFRTAVCRGYVLVSTGCCEVLPGWDADSAQTGSVSNLSDTSTLMTGTHPTHHPVRSPLSAGNNNFLTAHRCLGSCQ